MRPTGWGSSRPCNEIRNQPQAAAFWCFNDLARGILSLGRILADRRRRLDAVGPTQLLQPQDFVTRDQVLAAEHPGDQADLRKVLDSLHLVIRRKQVAADRQGAV